MKQNRFVQDIQYVHTWDIIINLTNYQSIKDVILSKFVTKHSFKFWGFVY